MLGLYSMLANMEAAFSIGSIAYMRHEGVQTI